MIALDYTIFVQIAAFILFWFLLSRLVFNPLSRVIDERERRTEGVKDEAESLKEERERLRRELEGQIAEANQEGNAIKEAIRQEALHARERLLARAQEDAARLLQMVREEIQTEVESGRETGAREAEAIARQMAVKILGRSIG